MKLPFIKKLSTAFYFSTLPPFMQSSYRQAEILIKKTNLLYKCVGEKEANKLINQFKSEAESGLSVNSVYICNKIDLYIADFKKKYVNFDFFGPSKTST